MGDGHGWQMNLTGRAPFTKGQKSQSAPRHDLRDAAEGETCKMRLPGCTGDTSTVVLCHIRRFGWAGMAEKPHDILGVHACHHCHAVMDGRIPGECTDTDILRGLGETLLAVV